MLVLLSFLLLFALRPHAVKHHMFVGTYGTSTIYGLVFDEDTNKLTVVRNNTTRTENEWLALSYNGKTLYSSGRSGWSSFEVTGPNEIGPETGSTPAVGSTCDAYNGVFVLASKKRPYSVYGSLACANYVPVSNDGQIGKAELISYNEKDDEKVYIYGMAMDPSYSYLYSIDWISGKIWTHQVNDNGTATVVGAVDAPSPVSAPKSVVVHPSGKTMYVVLEAWNALALYIIDTTNGMPFFTGGIYPLVPKGNFDFYL
jgi:carboxy-cis,cis-muconate cyclase